MTKGRRQGTQRASCSSRRRNERQTRVEDAHDLAFNRNRVGHVNDIVEDIGKAQRDRRFAIARRPIKKHGAAGVQRWTALLDDALGHGQFAKGFADAVIGDQLVGQLLQVDLLIKFVDGHGSRTGVAHLRQGVDDPAAASVGEGVTQVERVARLAGAECAQQLPVDGHLHQFDDDVVGQFDGGNKLAQRLEVLDVDELDEQAQQISGVELGGGDVMRFCWHPLEEGVQGCLGDAAISH
jgi:hypothetical protein